MKQITQKQIQEALTWAYDKTLKGMPGIMPAESLAEEYLKKGNSKDQSLILIRNQITKASLSGFITGCGGIVALPVMLPLNITSVLYLQLRMIGAIAYMGGYNLQDDHVQTLVYSCLLQNSVKEVLKDTGISIGNKLTMNMIKNIPNKVLLKINKKIGIRLITKFGEKGIVNMSKLVPIAGGILGGAFDGLQTRQIGMKARKLFILENEPIEIVSTSKRLIL